MENLREISDFEKLPVQSENIVNFGDELAMSEDIKSESDIENSLTCMSDLQEFLAFKMEQRSFSGPLLKHCNSTF